MNRDDSKIQRKYESLSRPLTPGPLRCANQSSVGAEARAAGAAANGRFAERVRRPGQGRPGSSPPSSPALVVRKVLRCFLQSPRDLVTVVVAASLLVEHRRLGVSLLLLAQEGLHGLDVGQLGLQPSDARVYEVGELARLERVLRVHDGGVERWGWLCRGWVVVTVMRWCRNVTLLVRWLSSELWLMVRDVCI